VKIVRKNTAKGHYYVDTDTGERVPGVTTINGGGLPSPPCSTGPGKPPPSTPSTTGTRWLACPTRSA
jgi:hypothetical protein